MNAWHISQTTQTTEDFLYSYICPWIIFRKQSPLKTLKNFGCLSEMVKSIKCSVEIVCPQTYFVLTGYILLRPAAMT